MTDELAVAGRVAVVTGAASGIGAAVARRLAAAGASVVVIDRDGPGARRVAREIGGTPVVTDLADPEGSRRAFSTAEALYGRIDLVHLNAGLLSGIPDITRVDHQRYREVTGVNIDAVVYGTQAAIPALRRAGGGAILVTSSIAGLTEFEFDPVYAMTKHAVIGLVRALAAPLAAQRITISALCPAFVDTAFLGAHRELFLAGGFQLLDPDVVAGVAVAELANGEAGRLLTVSETGEAIPYEFAKVG